MLTQEYAYRYNDVTYAAGLDEWDNPIGFGRIAIVLRRFRVLKHTPKGFWVDDICTTLGRRFILSGATKTYACLTEEAAKVSFVARKKAQIRIYSARLANAEKALEVALGNEAGFSPLT